MSKLFKILITPGEIGGDVDWTIPDPERTGLGSGFSTFKNGKLCDRQYLEINEELKKSICAFSLIASFFQILPDVPLSKCI